MMIVTIAAGSTIKKFCLNLSFILQPCVLYSRDRRIGNKGEVVSKHGAAYNSSNTDRNRKLVCCDTPSAIGASVVMVPMKFPWKWR